MLSNRRSVAAAATVAVATLALTPKILHVKSPADRAPACPASLREGQYPFNSYYEDSF